ncbi:hypothetical protein CP532_4746 [Ophiocordyceps camponoti-leonardi (nom. inval.)]|nr:hypothetical protein CP532_4746 [Ophiocordyceps camponoti-leonardi (nom. inval.)]
MANLDNGSGSSPSNLLEFTPTPVERGSPSNLLEFTPTPVERGSPPVPTAPRKTFLIPERRTPKTLCYDHSEILLGALKSTVENHFLEHE